MSGSLFGTEAAGFRFTFPAPARLLATVLSVALLVSCGSGGERTPARATDAPQSSSWESVEKTTDDGEIIIEKVAYRSDGLLIYGQVCRPARPGQYPVHIVNHHGFSGITDWNKGPCAQQARDGMVVAESSYRGEDGSEGNVEVCLGEVDDVLRLTDIVRAQPYADPARTMMSGVSHGACITTRAVQRGAPVQLAVAMSGPTDWAQVYESVADPARKLPAAVRDPLIKVMEKATGGTPAEVPDQYRIRSPRTFAQDLSTARVDFMMIHGTDDPLVPAQQGCLIADAASGFTSLHIAKDGSVSTAPPPGCEGMPLDWMPGPRPTTFPDNRYLLVYDKLPHVLAGPSAKWALADVMRFVGERIPPG